MKRIMLFMVMGVLSQLYAFEIVQVASIKAVTIKDNYYGQLIWDKNGILVPVRGRILLLSKDGGKIKDIYTNGSKSEVSEFWVDAVATRLHDVGFYAASESTKKEIRKKILEEQWMYFELPFFIGRIESAGLIGYIHFTNRYLLEQSPRESLGYDSYKTVDGLSALARFLLPVFAYTEDGAIIYYENRYLLNRALKKYSRVRYGGKYVDSEYLYDFEINPLLNGGIITRYRLVAGVANKMGTYDVGILLNNEGPLSVIGWGGGEGSGWPVPAVGALESFISINDEDFISCYGPEAGCVYLYKKGKPIKLDAKKMYQNYLPFSFAVSPDKDGFAYFSSSGELVVYKIKL